MGTQQLLRFATRPTTRWFAGLDQVSRRNAMVASTALAQRRLEYIEVEEFLAPYRTPSLPRPLRRTG